MTSAAEEDWSIISSSDYEDDLVSSQSVARIESLEDFPENCDDDLAAASVSTVRPESESKSKSKSISKSGTLFGSKIRVGGTPGLPQCGDLLLGPGEAAVGANRPRANMRLAPEAPWALVFAPLVALYSAVRGAAAHTTLGLRETDRAIKHRLRELFLDPLAHWRLRLDQEKEKQAQTKTHVLCEAVLGVLEATKPILLYFVILASVTAVAGSIFGTKLVLSRGMGMTTGSTSSKRPVLQFGVRVIDSDSLKVWARSSAVWFTRFKAKCSEKAWSVFDVVLYEDHREQSSWFGFGLGKMFHHEPARQLRLAKFWGQLNGHLHRGWRSIQDIHSKSFLLSLDEKLSIDQLSNMWRSWIGKIKYTEILLEVQVQVDQLRSVLAVLRNQVFHTYEGLARKWWQNFSTAAQPGLQAMSSTFNASLDSAKTWYFLGGPANFTELLARESRKIGEQVGHDIGWISSKTLQFTASVSLISSECQTQVNTVEKREHLFNTVKGASQKGVELFNRRIQLAALDVYQLSKSMAALIRS